MRKKELVLIGMLLMSMTVPPVAQAAQSQQQSTQSTQSQQSQQSKQSNLSLSEEDIVRELSSMPDTVTVTYNNYTLKGVTATKGDSPWGAEWEAEHTLPYVMYRSDGIYKLFDDRGGGGPDPGIFYYKSKTCYTVKDSNSYRDADGNYHSVKGKQGEDRYYWSGSEWILYETAEALDGRYDGELTIRDATPADNTIYSKVYLIDGEDIHPDQFKHWDPFAITVTKWWGSSDEKDEIIEYLKSHAADQMENKASIATCYNQPKMRKAVEELIGIDKLYDLSSGSTDLTKDAAKLVGLLIFSNDNYKYSKNSISRTVLAEDASGKEIRDKLAQITSDTLGLESNLPCSWVVPLLVYYNRLDNNRGLLKLPSSLNDSISKRDFINIVPAVAGAYGFNLTLEDNLNTVYSVSDSDGYKTLRDVVDNFSGLKAAVNTGKKLATNPYEEAALAVYFADDYVCGSLYGDADANQESLDSPMTRLEALYNINTGYAYGMGQGFYSMLDYIQTSDFLTDGLGEGYGTGKGEVYKDFSLDEISLDEIKFKGQSYMNDKSGGVYSMWKDTNLDGVNEYLTEEEIALEMEGRGLEGAEGHTRIIKKVISEKKVAVGKQKVSREKKEKIKLLGIEATKTIKQYKFQKKVKGKIKYKWAQNKPGKGWKHVYKVKYKTVQETEDVLRVCFSGSPYTDADIDRIRKDMDTYFRDGSDYYVMSLDEFNEAKEKVDFYRIWATQGYSKANATMNAYALSKNVLTPDMAGEIVSAYEQCLFTTTVEGNLDLFSECTWDDAITWGTLHKATLTTHLESLEKGGRWEGYRDIINCKVY